MYDGALARCGQCGLVATARTPEFTYDEGYFTRDTGGGYDFDSALSIAMDEGRFVSELRRLEAQGLRGTVLDVGCATGVFLTHAQKRGWRVAGVEVAAYARERSARQLAAPVVESLASLPHGATFDVVTLHHVLEHINDPLEFLRDDVAPRVGRRLLVEVPNFRSLASRVHRHRWRDLRLDQHVHHFDASTLARVVSAAGLHVDRVYTLWEPVWSLRTAFDVVRLAAGAMMPWKYGPIDLAEPALGIGAAERYGQGSMVKRVLARISRPLFWPLVRGLEATGLGGRLVIEAAPRTAEHRAVGLPRPAAEQVAR